MPVIEALVGTSQLHSVFHGLVLGYTLRGKSTLYGGTQKHLYGIVLVSIDHLYLVDWTGDWTGDWTVGLDWGLDWGLDLGVDWGLDLGLDWGLDLGLDWGLYSEKVVIIQF